MSEPTLDVVALGNAIVDVLADVDDGFLAARGMAKGAMSLVDEAEADALQRALTPRLLCSGGSAANTTVGIASLGGRAAFVGKVRDDAVGATFADDIRRAGVTFATPPATSGPGTGRCLVMVTPDAQRTMRTFLGAAGALAPDDVAHARDLIGSARVVYLEGYLFDPAPARQAFHEAARLAHAAGREVALSLSDSFCVERHRGALRAFVREHVDVLFANEDEILSLYETARFDDAVDAVAGACPRAVVTRGAEGAVYVAGPDRGAVPAEPVERVVDTTGAGDLFAAGFLYGHTRGRSARRCARLGAIAAAEIVSHYGARPEARLADRVAGRID